MRFIKQSPDRSPGVALAKSGKGGVIMHNSIFVIGISKTQKNKGELVSSPLVYVALFFIAFSSHFLCPHFALPCLWYRKWAI